MKRSCEDCGKPVVFTVKGGKVQCDDEHMLCNKCWRNRLNQSRAGEMKSGEVVRR